MVLGGLGGNGVGRSGARTVLMCISLVELGESFDAWEVKWKTRLGSMSPDRVAPGRPAKGVSPMEVSRLRPERIAHALAPLPRWRAIRERLLEGRLRNVATERRMKA